MFKKVLLLITTLCLLLSFNLNVYGDENYNNINTVTYEEYVKLYAKNNTITYEEAKEKIDIENEEILYQHCLNSGIGIFSIDYQDGYPKDDVIIYYVDVYDYLNDELVSIRYGALGKVIVDTHGKTFIDKSWETYYSPNSGQYEFIAPKVTVDQQDYTHVRLYCNGTVEVSKSYAFSLGFSIADLFDFGYTDQGNNYYRHFINDWFVQTP